MREAFRRLAGLAGAIAVSFGAFVPLVAHAEMPPFYSLGERPEKDILAAGLLYFHAPRYAGASEQKTYIVPSATAVLANGAFADVVNGVGFNFSTDKRFEVGVRASLGIGRDDTPALRGIGHVPARIVVGGFANWNVTDRFSLQSTARYGSGVDANGLLVDVGASYDVIKWDHGSISLETSASWADTRYMRSFYGVSASQAALSGFPAFSPKAGVQWNTVGVSLTTPLHEKVLASLSVDRTRLSGDAASGPLVERSRSWAIEANVSWLF